MSQDGAAQLVNFIHEAFGARCAELLLVGLGEEPVEGTKKFYVLDAEDDTAWEVEVEVVGGILPCRSEPLVLATLLKMLLGREGVPSTLEFHVSEVVDELRRFGVMLTDDDVNRVISKYVALSYDKRAKDGNESDAGGGVYSLMTGYFRDSRKAAGKISPVRVSISVQFEQSFVAELRKDEVTLAGIRFGRVGKRIR